MVVNEPLDLCGGFWGRHYPSPVPGQVAAAEVHQARAATHVPFPVTPAAAAQPLPAGLKNPAWVAPSAGPGGPFWVAGLDYSVSAGAAAFADPLSPLLDYKTDPTTGRAVVWAGDPPPPPVTSTPQAGSYLALARAAGRYTGVPPFSADGVVRDVARTGRGWCVVTDTDAITLNPNDAPVVAVGQAVRAGDPAGGAWRLVRMGPRTPAEPRLAIPGGAYLPNPGAPGSVFVPRLDFSDYRNTQYDLMLFTAGGSSGLGGAFTPRLDFSDNRNSQYQMLMFAAGGGVGNNPVGGGAGPLVFYNSQTPLAVDTTQPLTRVRFAIGGSQLDVTAFWLAVEAANTQGHTLANALDLRATPYGEPRATDLPATVNPADLLCRLVLGGGAYMLVTDPTRYGPAADPAAVADYPAGPAAAVWPFPGGVPSPAPYLPPF